MFYVSVRRVTITLCSILNELGTASKSRFIVRSSVRSVRPRPSTMALSLEGLRQYRAVMAACVKDQNWGSERTLSRADKRIVRKARERVFGRFNPRKQDLVQCQLFAVCISEAKDAAGAVRTSTPAALGAMLLFPSAPHPHLQKTMFERRAPVCGVRMRTPFADVKDFLARMVAACHAAHRYRNRTSLRAQLQSTAESCGGAVSGRMAAAQAAALALLARQVLPDSG